MGLTRVARIKRLNRPLLVTFDAYGTLYRPRAPIHLLYEAVAKEHGMRIQGSDKLNKEFGKAFLENRSIYPNYGKNLLSSPDEWWRKVVNETFQASAAPGQKVPRHLASDLINRFSGSAFYHYMKSVPSTIKTLRNIEANSDFPVIIGVISNSDPRIASILRSLGFSVGDEEPMRSIQPPPLNAFDSTSSAQEQQEQQERRQPPLIDRAKRPDFDFVLTSYDAEYQKPEREIFGVAERYAADMMRRLPAPATHNLTYSWPYPFYRLHVGDDIHKDAVAAANAGWKALVYEDRAFLRELHPEEKDALSRKNAPRCIDMMRGIKKIVNEWCELQKVQVEMSEDSKEGREWLAKEARKRESMERNKKAGLDPEKLAAIYERALEDQMRQSTPEKYYAGQVSHTASRTSEQRPSGSENTTAPPPSSSPPSSSSSSPPSPSHPARIEANIAEWRATGVKNSLTNVSTSFLRPSNLQTIRKNDTPLKPQQQQEQQITQPLEVRQQRALQRKRGKLLKRLPEMQHVPIFVPDSTIDKWNQEKKKMLARISARRREKLQRQQGFKSDMYDVDSEDDEFPEGLVYDDDESRSKPVPSLEDGGGGGGGGDAAQKQEEQNASAAATDAPTTPSLDVEDTTKKIDSGG